MYKLTAWSALLKRIRIRKTFCVIIFRDGYWNDALCDTLPINENISSMPNVSFDGVDIAIDLNN